MTLAQINRVIEEVRRDLRESAAGSNETMMGRGERACTVRHNLCGLY
jgi:hypothetical protein